MKYLLCRCQSIHLSVTSYAEVWIEILLLIRYLFSYMVTSYAEVWIEMW